MEFSGQILDSAGRRIKDSSFGILSASGQILAGPTDTDDDGSFLLNASEGERVFFSAPGYVTKVYNVPFRELIIVLNKPINLATIAAVASAAWLILGNKKKKKLGALPYGITNDDVKTIFFIIGGFLSLDIITKILRSLGIFKDPQSTALDLIATDPNSFWNPNMWKQSQAYSYTISQATAEQYAEQINDALGWFNDDESAIIGVFHQMRTQANISFLAYVYQQKFGKDLFTTLRGGNWPQDGISESDLTSINEYGKTLIKF